MQKGHVIRLQFRCRRCHQFKRTWSSSRVFAGHYVINQKYIDTLFLLCINFTFLDRLVHSFTCAGILQSQYIKLTSFARLGIIQNGYIRHGTFIHDMIDSCYLYILLIPVYNSKGYVDIVSQAAESCMQEAVKDVQSLPHYESDGEVFCINDPLFLYMILQFSF